MKNTFTYLFCWLLCATGLLLGQDIQAQADMRDAGEFRSDISSDAFQALGYFDQAAQLSSMVKAQPANAELWYAYYNAKRYSYYSAQSKDLNANEQKTLDGIVSEMETNIAQTYEYHYIKYWNGNHDPALFNHLEKAYALEPQRTELLDDFVAHYELTGEADKKQAFCKKLKQANVFPQQVIHYNHNVLASLEPNAILITNGEYDTYPVWILQEVDGFRKDVTVLNGDLLQQEAYRLKKLAALKLKSPGSFKSISNFVEGLAKKNPLKPIYFGMTMRPDVLKHLQNNLYLTGLAFKYSAGEIDNVPVLKSNWETKFKIDHLNQTTTNSTIKRLHMNYVMPLLSMHAYYGAQGQFQQAQKMRSLAIQIATAAGRAAEVEALFE